MLRTSSCLVSSCPRPASRLRLCLRHLAKCTSKDRALLRAKWSASALALEITRARIVRRLENLERVGGGRHA